MWHILVVSNVLRLWIALYLLLCSSEVCLKCSCYGLLQIYGTLFFITTMLNCYHLPIVSLDKTKPLRQQPINHLILLPALFKIITLIISGQDELFTKLRAFHLLLVFIGCNVKGKSFHLDISYWHAKLCSRGFIEFSNCKCNDFWIQFLHVHTQ